MQTSVASYIRLFELLVIKSLKQYTVTSRVALKQQVLDLLAQVIHPVCSAVMVAYVCICGGLQTSVASYIRLFEPLVIKSLKQYTVTSQVALQQQVLDLLAQLVQLRVNYCLLDSDQVFVSAPPSN